MIRLQKFRGSSPRMWGTLLLAFVRLRSNRFIPTHVRNTGVLCVRVWVDAVHPHACGEHRRSLCPGVGRCGSSPRMWGTHPYEDKRTLIWRFIPTHVGNTFCCYKYPLHYPVHPHACGEHGLFWYLVGLLTRFIPTHVGNTLKQILF